MKKLVVINLILILIYCILPNEIQKNINETVENTVKEIQQEIVQTEERPTEEQKQVSNLNISFDMNLLTKSNITIEELQKGFANTNMQGLEQYFINAENETGINAIYFAGLATHESGWNTSDFARERNNLFGWQSYDSNLNATKRFTSKEESIMTVARALKKMYLSENGCYFNGYTISGISKRYASDKQHNQKVFRNMQKIVDKIK